MPCGTRLLPFREKVALIRSCTHLETVFQLKSSFHLPGVEIQQAYLKLSASWKAACSVEADESQTYSDWKSSELLNNAMYLLAVRAPPHLTNEGAEMMFDDGLGLAGLRTCE